MTKYQKTIFLMKDTFLTKNFPKRLKSEKTCYLKSKSTAQQPQYQP